MIDLEKRLDSGPLEVRTLWSSEKTERLAPAVLLRRRRRFFVRSTASAMSCVLLVVVAFLATASSRSSRTMDFSKRELSAIKPRKVSLADGSRALLASDDANLRTDLDRADHVRLRLLGGAVHFDVVPRKGRAFEVECGEVTVKVVGTAFKVQRLGAKARVSVAHGRVEVAWRAGHRLLGAGEQGIFPPEESMPSPSSGSPRLESGAAGDNPNGWRELARQRRYDRAYTELFERRAEGPPQGPADLLLAADVARLSRHPADAVSPLKNLMLRFGGDSRAPVAAFTLGRVLSEDLGRASEAADAFERARRLAPSGPLALEALAREINARKRAGQGQAAQRLAREYLNRYPDGRHAPKLRGMLAAP